MKHRVLAILVAFLTGVWMQASCPCRDGGLTGLFSASHGLPVPTACCHADHHHHHGDGACPDRDSKSDPPVSPCCCGGMPPQLPPPPAPMPPAPSLSVVAWLDTDSAVAGVEGQVRRSAHLTRFTIRDRASDTLLRRHCALII